MNSSEPTHAIHKEALVRHLTTRGDSVWGSSSVPRVVCADGFTMSVQASEMHFCRPKNSVGPWVSVEVGYPNRIEPLLFEYAESPGAWVRTVYPYVPIDLVAAVIELHGGFIDPT